MLSLCIIDWKYIAGFFDGEGCATFQTNKTKKCYSVLVSIVNTNRNILEEMQKIAGGKIYSRKTISNRHKIAYALTFTNHREQLNFLENIYPYAFIKKIQIGLIIEWIKSRNEKNIGIGYRRCIPCDFREQQIFEIVRSLNKKG